MDKNLIITVVGVALAVMGLVFVLTSSQETSEKTQIDKPKTMDQMIQELEKWCEKNFMEYGHTSGEECFIKEKAIFDPQRVISDCMEHFLDMEFSSNAECFQYSQTRNQPYDSP